MPRTERPDLREKLMDRHAQAVVSSALWAAAGDAVGWIGELTDERGVRRRVGSPRIHKPVTWRRKLGRFGPTVQLPAGTYSDDTQLRLAVSRAIRASGEFDIEAFAKVELPVWLAYSLGGGRGTVAAATNLGRNNVAWFSNFFARNDGPQYVESGGNGAAMRVQPHVWKSDPSKHEAFIPDVLRDAVVTHGAPQGFCGAVFHALCLVLYFSLTQATSAGSGRWSELSEGTEMGVGRRRWPHQPVGKWSVTATFPRSRSGKGKSVGKVAWLRSRRSRPGVRRGWRSQEPVGTAGPVAAA